MFTQKDAQRDSYNAFAHLNTQGDSKSFKTTEIQNFRERSLVYA